MKINSKKIVEITLTMNSNEAIWLKGQMQNPFEEEGKKSKTIREIFFNTLKEELEGT